MISTCIDLGNNLWLYNTEGLVFAEGEQSMHDSLEELADLLGDEEMLTEMNLREGREDPAATKPKTPNPKHRAGI